MEIFKKRKMTRRDTLDKPKYCRNTTLNSMNKNMETLIEVLNHRVTKLEVHVGWLKKLMGYMAVLLTGIAVKIICFS